MDTCIAEVMNYYNSPNDIYKNEILPKIDKYDHENLILDVLADIDSSGLTIFLEKLSILQSHPEIDLIDYRVYTKDGSIDGYAKLEYFDTEIEVLFDAVLITYQPEEDEDLDAVVELHEVLYNINEVKEWVARRL